MNYENLQKNVRNRNQLPTFVTVVFIDEQESLHEYHREELNKGTVTWGYHKLIERDADVRKCLDLKKVASPHYIPKFFPEANIDNTVVLAVALTEYEFLSDDYTHVFNVVNNAIEDLKLLHDIEEI